MFFSISCSANTISFTARGVHHPGLPKQMTGQLHLTQHDRIQDGVSPGRFSSLAKAAALGVSGVRQTTPSTASSCKPAQVGVTQLMPECGGLLEHLSNGVSQFWRAWMKALGDDKRPVAG